MTTSDLPPTRLDEILAALRTYRDARETFLRSLGCNTSNRDPFAEFSEQLVAALLGGELASSRVQKGWDLTTPEQERVQVRYLANPADRWVNEHLVDFRADCDRYALVVFEAFDPKSVLVFDRRTIGGVCGALGKRHPDRDVTLQLTRRNYRQIIDEPQRFVTLGVVVVDLGFATPGKGVTPSA